MAESMSPTHPSHAIVQSLVLAASPDALDGVERHTPHQRPLLAPATPVDPLQHRCHSKGGCNGTNGVHTRS
eukprot:4681305-Amphidinium_carterae.1